MEFVAPLEPIDIGLIKFQKGEYSKAVESLERHLRAVPADSSDRNSTVLLLLAMSYAHLERTEDAIRYFAEGYDAYLREGLGPKRDSWSTPFLTYYAEVLRVNGQHAKADEVMRAISVS